MWKKLVVENDYLCSRQLRLSRTRRILIYGLTHLSIFESFVDDSSSMGPTITWKETFWAAATLNNHSMAVSYVPFHTKSISFAFLAQYRADSSRMSLFNEGMCREDFDAKKRSIASRRSSKRSWKRVRWRTSKLGGKKLMRLWYLVPFSVIWRKRTAILKTLRAWKLTNDFIG